MKQLVLTIMCSFLLTAANAAEPERKDWWSFPDVVGIPDTGRLLVYDPTLPADDVYRKTRNVTWLIMRQLLGYTHPATHPATMIVEDTEHQYVTAAQKLYWNAKVDDNDPRLSDARTPLTHDQAATTITYSNTTYTTVAAALDHLLYVPISISSYTLSGSGSNITQELGSSYTIQSPGLAWTTNKTATTQTINGTPQTSPYMPNSPVSSNQTWTLLVGDGTTTASSTRTVNFTHKRYWGVSSAAAIDDAGIITLSSEFSTSRSQTRTMTASAQYLYIVYVDTAGAASFTVNGFSDTSWQLTQRSFTNASGYSTTFRIYRSANPLTGTYTVVVS